MLSIEEIRQITFSKSLMGYSPQEVDRYLSSLTKAVENARKEQQKLQEELSLLRTQVEQLQAKDKENKHVQLRAERACERFREATRYVSLLQNIIDCEAEDEALVYLPQYKEIMMENCFLELSEEQETMP